MIYGETREAVEKARAAFTKKWRLRCAPVVASLEEAGDELFTFLRFRPAVEGAAGRPTRSSASTRSFRRRTKTQGLLPSEERLPLAPLRPPAHRPDQLRRLDGWQEIRIGPDHGEGRVTSARTTTANRAG